MESLYTELALYGSKNECARTVKVYLSISEVCDGMVSLLLDKSSKTKHIKDNCNIKVFLSSICLRLVWTIVEKMQFNLGQLSLTTQR